MQIKEAQIVSSGSILNTKPTGTTKHVFAILTTTNFVLYNLFSFAYLRWSRFDTLILIFCFASKEYSAYSRHILGTRSVHCIFRRWVHLRSAFCQHMLIKILWAYNIQNEAIIYKKNLSFFDNTWKLTTKLCDKRDHTDRFSHSQLHFCISSAYSAFVSQRVTHAGACSGHMCPCYFSSVWI